MPRRIALLPIASFVVLTCDQSTAPVLADHVVVRGPATVYLGGRGQFTATPISADGDTLVSRHVTWSSSDTAIVSTTQQGLVTTHALGDATINAEVDGKVGTAPLSVLLVPVRTVDVQPRGIDSLYVGDSLQMTATPRDSIGGALAGRPIEWTTSDTTKATVSSTGLVHARAPGSFTVTATSGGKTGGTFLNAQLRAVTLVMPDSFTLGLHHVVRLIPALQSASGTQLSGRTVAWSSSSPAVLAVNANGVLTPQQIGSATIHARHDTLTDSSLVRVIPEPIVSIGMWWIAPVSVADTTLEAIQAIAYDATSQYTTGGAPTWTSSDTTVARVAPSPSDPWRALVTGAQPGTTRITSQSGSIIGAYNLTLVYPMARLVALPESLMLGVGDSRPLTAVGTDRFGNRQNIYGYWGGTSADTTIAAVIANTPVYISARKPGRTSVEVRTAGAFADTVAVVVSDTGAPRLFWEYGYNTFGIYNYTTVGIRLISADSTGTPSTVPRDIQFHSTDTTIAVAVPAAIIGMTGAQTITIQGRKPGLATITAVSDSQFAPLVVAVFDQPPASIQLEAAPSALHVGDSLRLHATGQGQYPVAWRTTDENKATVSDSGTLVAVGVGDVAVIATTGPVSDTAAFTILSNAPPVVTSVAPQQLVPGASVTFTGSGFDPDPAANTILVDSVHALITAASDTQLTFTLPVPAAWPCTLTHYARVLIQSGGRLGLDSFPLSVATQTASLATGDVLDLTGTTCTEMPTGDGYPSYVVTVVNTDLQAPASFAFRGAAAIVNPPPAQVAAAAKTPPPAGLAAPTPGFSIDSLRRSALFHRRLLEQSRALSLRAAAPAPLLRAARLSQPQRSVTATINGIAVVRVPKLEDPDFCSSYQTIYANVVYDGTHVRILEDRAAPVPLRSTSVYQTLGHEFDEVMYPKLLANFGNPLALDSLLDGDGRIAMVFSPVVNRYGALGFVVSCDFYPESVAPSSNTGEIFYAQVPTASGNGFNSYTIDVWRWLIRSVAMHESKHITAFAERLSRGATIEDTWLEEASAVLAEELWSRSIYGTQGKDDAVYRWTLYCDVRPTWPQCLGRPYSMFNAFAFLYDYARQLELRTPLGPTAYDDATFYGSGWSFLRWAIDQSSTPESDFTRQLIQEPSLAGIANLAARAERPYEDMLSDWSDALYYDAWGIVPPRPTWSMPSWKMDDIFRGMSADFPNSFPTSHPFEGRRWNFGGPFSFEVQQLPPGGWAVFVGSGNPWQLSTELFDLHSTTGGPAPAPLRIRIARSQ